MSKLKELFLKYKEIILYVFFGGLTTVVNWAVFFPLYNLLHVDEHIANIAAWIVAVIFAFVTNKLWVFESKSGESGLVLRELGLFAGGRLLSLGVEEAMLFAGRLLSFNINIVKIAAAVVVVIMNYVISKLFVFGKKKK